MSNYDKIVQAYIDDDQEWTLDDIDVRDHPLILVAVLTLDKANELEDLRWYKDQMSRNIKYMEAMRDAVEVE